MKKNQNEFFRTIKQMLSTYQILNTICENLQQDLTFIVVDTKKFKIKIEIQKQKIANMRRVTIARTIELKIFLKTKKEKISKFQKSRNAHRKNFEKIDVKIKIFFIDKKTMKKIIENFERRIRNAKSHMSLKNFDKKNRDFARETNDI